MPNIFAEYQQALQSGQQCPTFPCCRLNQNQTELVPLVGNECWYCSGGGGVGIVSEVLAFAADVLGIAAQLTESRYDNGAMIFY